MTFRTAALWALLAAALPHPASAAPIRLREVRQSLFASCFPTDREGWMDRSLLPGA